ncbi:src like adaptor 1a [Rhinoraja longicauda]
MGNANKSPATQTETLDTETPERDSNNIVVMLYDYLPPTISQPVYKTGEKLRIVAEEGDWWRVQSIVAGRESYIPRACVARVYHGWLFEGIGRRKAEELLQLADNRMGSFLIRQSESLKGTYCLSVRHFNEGRQKLVKHYRISRLPNRWYYIQQRLTFQCLEDLVNHYSEVVDGLCCLLTHPCLAQLGPECSHQPVILRNSNFSWRNVNRAELLGDVASHRGDPVLSYGLRHSVASYMSLSQLEDQEVNRGGKKRWHQSFTPRRQNRHSCLLPLPPQSLYEDDFIPSPPQPLYEDDFE